MKRTCSSCTLKKPLSEFSKSTKNTSGHQSYCKPCATRIKHLNLLKIRDIIFNHYGICACCGEKNRAFLTIDHINNDGAEHRRSIKKGKGVNFYIWVIRNDFPTFLQSLCYNCNCGKHSSGLPHCPHLVP